MAKFKGSGFYKGPRTRNTILNFCQEWDLLVCEHSLGFQIKIGRPKFYAGEMITLA